MTDIQPDEVVVPRFYARSLPRSFGLLLAAGCAVPLVMTILAMLSDTSVFLILASVMLVLLFAAGMVTGLLAVAASMERVHIRADGVRVCLGKLTLAYFPAETIRSAVANARGYRMRMTDRHIYLIQLFFHNHRYFTFWLQWSTPTAEAFAHYLPNVDLLL